MKPVDRQKICSNCDGRIPMNAKECIYCGADQPEQMEVSKLRQPALQDNLSSLYAPPYAAKNQNSFTSYEETKKESSTMASSLSQEEEDEPVRSGFLSIFLLVIGTNLFTIGLLQFFFSTEGLLALEWDSSYWFFYCLVAMPMCYLGYKKINS